MIEFNILRLPYNWKTPFGYAIAFFGTYAGMSASLFSCTPIMCFVIASCYLIATFLTDIKSDLSGLNASKTRKMNCQKLEKRLSNIIRQFCSIEQLSKSYRSRNKLLCWNTKFQNYHFYMISTFRFIISLNNIYEFIIFGYFVWSLTTIGATLFLLNTLLVGKVYLMLEFTYAFIWFQLISWLFAVAAWFKSIWGYISYNDGDVFSDPNSFLLWMWWICNQSIRWVWWWAISKQLA